MPSRRRRAAVATALAALLTAAAPAAAQLPPVPTVPGVPVPVPTPPVPVPGATGSGPAPSPYGTNDGGGFHDILPPGTRGLYNAPQLAAFLATGATQPHCCDQLAMYGDLVYATPGLKAADLAKYYKDSTFGVRDGDAERTYSPRPDVTIVRDKGFGVPHVYGATRAGAMFGLGYAGAEDRLFFMDVLRHAGRGELSSFAGGSNAAMDAQEWEVAPYTEADLTRQANDLPRYLGAQGTQLQADVDQYVAGINEYIAEAKLDPTKLPGEYAAIGRPQGPDPWKREDLIATAALVGGIFGKGGGEELRFSQIADALQRRFGRARGLRIFRDFRSAEDPEAPVTVFKRRFPYETPYRGRPHGLARPDRGSLRLADVVAARSGGGGSASAARARAASTAGAAASPGAGLLAFPPTQSNALLVAGRRSRSGHPLMVAGPQVGYFNPQILMEEDVHAPASASGPAIDARGAAFNGINLYVQLGRGRDYAWSATSAGQDIVDTFALRLCDATHYRFRGRCEPIEVLEKTNRWSPTPGDQTPAGTQTLRAERTKLGLVAGRGTVHGKPVIFTKLRSTYFHEVDSAAGFMDFNDPGKVRDTASFERAAAKIGYTFNWFYADPKHIAYFNSGANPVRAPRIDHDFPVSGTRAHEWRGWDPSTWTMRTTRASAHPQAVDQTYLVNWNNKQARGFASSDENAYSSTYRSVLLERRLKAALRRGRLTLPGLVDVMEGGGTADLRANVDLPLALTVLGRQRDPALARAIRVLRGWVRSGGQRRDHDRNGVYDHAEAVRILDAWWPAWVRAEFRPTLGRTAFRRLAGALAVDNTPNGDGQHHGSAYQGSWYGFVSKDLRTVLGRHVRGRYARRYCGGGTLRGCRRVLAQTLKAALAAPASRLYGGDATCAKAGRRGDQWCFDAVLQRPVGGTAQPLIHWINRPTYQQADEIQRRVGR